MGDSLSLNNVLKYDEVLLDAGVGALFFHRRDVAGLEVDDAAVEAGLVDLVQELGCGVEVVGFFR